MAPDQRTLDQLSLSREEYDRIVDLLDREPNEVELGMFGAMWTEHCGYKNSRPLLQALPVRGPRRPDEGRRGERRRHRHRRRLLRRLQDRVAQPPVGRRAVRGRGDRRRRHRARHLRDGRAADRAARLAALRAAAADDRRLNAGSPASPPQALPAPRRRRERRRATGYLFNGVVAGIGGYGNCLGIPTVGGEVSFAPSYNGNPLVNAMCVGVARSDKLRAGARATASATRCILVGADTGRDGIHGATFAASQLDEASEERRPTVQVGNPFLEKLLMEACVELAEEHDDWIVGLQDLGAAGLTSSHGRVRGEGGHGPDIDVAKVPRREQGMTPYEVMLSESQERMLVIVKPEHEARRARRSSSAGSCTARRIGIVTDDGIVRIHDDGVEVARDAGDAAHGGADVRARGREAAGLDELQAFDLSTLPDVARRREQRQRSAPTGGKRCCELLASPEIASKRLVWRQYDHQVRTNTVVGPGSDAAVLRIKGTTKALAIATDGNAAYTYLDPYVGGAIAVAEAAATSPAPARGRSAMTDCLNFGNPEKPDVYFQLEEAIRGMADAAKALGIPVISGNVSLYNEIERRGDLADAGRRRRRARSTTSTASCRWGFRRRATRS